MTRRASNTGSEFIAFLLRDIISAWQMLSGSKVNVTADFGSPAAEAHEKPATRPRESAELLPALGENSCANRSTFQSLWRPDAEEILPHVRASPIG